MKCIKPRDRGIFTSVPLRYLYLLFEWYIMRHIVYTMYKRGEQMDEVKIKAHAKINLSLDVVGKREDGYHLLQMIMQEIGLYDTITIAKNTLGSVRLASSASYLPTGQDNIAFRAAELMRATYGIARGFDIHIEKHIPVAAGLAGGSTDAAAVMRGIRSLENIQASDQDLMDLSLALGSDIPFCFLGGTALAEGIGDALTPLSSKGNYWVLLVKPALSVSTPHVYKQLQWQAVKQHPDTRHLIEAIDQGNLRDMARAMGNVLETVTVSEHPVIDQIKKKLMAYGAVVSQMSGSGPTVFGLFKRDDLAKKAYKNMKRFYQQTYLVRPVTRRVTHAE